MAATRLIRYAGILGGGTTLLAYGITSLMDESKTSSATNIVHTTLKASGPDSKPQKLPTRQMLLNELKNTPEFDILVIGGGATGTGVALDAVTRGMSTALVEADDFASGTSSKSTKLIHGGVRYLQKAIFDLDYEQYKMVKEALSERATMIKAAPHLAYALPIMLPLYKWWQLPYYYVGIKCYDLVAGSQCLKSSYVLGPKKTLEKFPMLQSKNLWGAIVYYDGGQNDSRMNVTLAISAIAHGAVVSNHVSVTSLIKDASGRVRGAQCKDELTGETFNVRAKCVVNATGPFTDNIRLMDDKNAKKICQGSAGVHITLPNYYCPKDMGLLDPQTSDGRVIFFLPWEGLTIAGTTDKSCPITTNPQPTENDIQFILSEVRHYLSPELSVRRGDVFSAWSGIRPLVLDTTKPPKAGKTEAIARNHIIYVSDSGLVTIAGGKWTTYRSMAEETVDECIKSRKGTEEKLSQKHAKSQTVNIILEGGAGYTPLLYIRLAQDFGMDVDIAQHLAHNYGDRAFSIAKRSSPTGQRWPIVGVRLHEHFPFIEAEVRYAVTKEYACTLVDVIARRLRLSFLNTKVTETCLPRIADIMAEELRWDQKRKQSEIAAAKQFLDTQMGGALNRDINSASATNSPLAKNYSTKFSALDTENRGFITTIELKKALKEDNFRMKSDNFHELLSEIDLKNAGQLELDEYIELMVMLQTGQRPAKMYMPVDRRSHNISVERSGGGI